MPGMASRGRGRRTINEINMVPFIDVMLCCSSFSW